MTADPLILDGRPVAETIKAQTAEEVQSLKAMGITPCLATVLVGDDPASATYVRMKAKACQAIGIASRQVHLDARSTTDDVIAAIEALNQDPQVWGILLQHPSPEQVDERAAFEAIAVDKDVDGVTSSSFGRTALGMPGFPACTPQAIMGILAHYDISPSGKHAVVIGRSPILGRPVAQLLLNQDATVTICHSKTTDLESHVRSADILVAAVGRPRFVQGDWVKPGAVVLDAGYNPGNVGDVDYDSALKRAGAITPVPGGVGPVTIATLLRQTVQAAEVAVARS